MRRLSVALTCLVLAPGLAGLAGCSTSDVTAPPSPTAAVSKQAGGEELPALGPGRMAYFLLEGVFQGAGAQGYNFLSDLLTGDGSGVKQDATMAKLDGISSQLSRIDDRLKAIDTDLTSLRAQYTAGELSDQLEQMDQWNNSMITLYKEYFRPVLAAAKDVSTARTNLDYYKQNCLTTASATPTPTASATPSPTNTKCSTTQADLEQTLKDKVAVLGDRNTGVKGDFKDQFDRENPFVVAANQHDQLFPKSANEISVLKLEGQALESKGYTTWADSQRLNALYLSLSDQEALSALLVFEHDKMFNAPDETQATHRTDYQQFNDIERANLPKEIPWGQVKVGQQLFMVPDDPQHEAFGAWLPISPEQKPLGTFSPLTKVLENPGWSLPTAAQLGALHAGTKNTPVVDIVVGTENKGPSTPLGSIWKNSGNTEVTASSPVTKEQAAIQSWGQKWFWTSDTSQSGMMKCYPPGKGIYTQRYYTLHHASYMGADGYRTEVEPAVSIDQATGNGAECDAAYENPNYGAATMLTQPIPEGVDYMAQRVNALPVS